MKEKFIIGSNSLSASYDFTAFGEKLNTQENVFNPWQFASKRFDSELDLIYFGKRYYNPTIGRWITTDPAGFIDSTNLYQYVFNNPFRYYDPNGEHLLGLLGGIGQIAIGGVLAFSGGALEFMTCGGYTFMLGVHGAAAAGFVISGCATVAYHAQDIKLPNFLSKNTNTYVPDSSLDETSVSGEYEDYSTTCAEKRSSRPDPDIKAEGKPHTIIERPGPEGQYTTHNGDGTFKQYRGSGKPHGNIPRPNIKETKNNLSPNGPRPGKPEVRKPTPDEIPKGRFRLNIDGSWEIKK